ncbi:putative MPP superfamily phosphohydrolase [Pseudomonas sp. BIGb0381]|uniref:metallophosphoesterase n=1 Tax=Pseudomonas sp. BIGb0381 TaxID=2940608 RepID=UPI0021689867|nr:metallophosphoesterase [Pseudomonas sp. BIGb0381]MCS4314572.1 putative MPP superfamily phosphohydrolase [Pseudomonas sp. BIGb0381]
MTPTLGWLHISDLHFLDKHAWRDNQPLQKLIEDLAALLKDGLRVDLVLCTGDIGFGETKTEPLASQYADAKAFFDKVLETCKLPSERLFLVPGNHDIDRSKVRKSQTEWLRSNQRNPDQINQDFRDSDAEVKQAMERLAAYRKFIADHYPHISLDDKATFAAKVKINGISITLSGLNSAWTCVDNDDRNQIWLAGEAQLHACSKVIEAQADGNQSNVRLCLMHHPRDWFQPSEAQALRGRLEQDFDFVLHGHAHDQWVDEKATPKHVVIAAGATTGESPLEFGYNLVQIAPGRAEVHLRRYDKKGCGWIEENIHGRTKQGIWHLAPLANLPALAIAAAPISALAPSGASPLSRGHLGLEAALLECSNLLRKNSLLAVFGMAGVGKSVLVEELHMLPEWQKHRGVQITAREDSGITDLFGQLAPLLGIHDERPSPPAGDTAAKVAENLRHMAPDAPGFFLHIQRAHHWLQNGHWKDMNLSYLLEGLSLAYPESAIVLETREQPVVSLTSFEATGLPKQVLAHYLATPPGLTTGWVLTGDQRTYLFSRLGGGHGRGAHSFGLALLVRLAAEKSISPYDVLRQYPDLYSQALYEKLFRDLYENVLLEGERALLFACSLYRDGLHYTHLPRLERATSAQDAGAALIRRRLLTERADWLYLHDLAAEQALKLSPDETRTLNLHQIIAGFWLDELQGQKTLMEANIRRALEALYHLEQGGQGERVAEIVPILFGRRPEETVQALWRIEERFISQKQDAKVLMVLEYLLKVSPNDHRAMRFLGECRRRLYGPKDQHALELFRQATQLDSGFPIYWTNYGSAVIASEDKEGLTEFLAEVTGASERVRNDNHVVGVYAGALEAMGRGDDAASLRQEKIDAGSRSPALYADHAKWLMDKKGDADAALALLELARKRTCDNDITEAIYASALEAVGRGDDAASLRQEKIDAGNRNPAFYADHAKWLMDKKGDADAALALLELLRKRGLQR